MQKNPEKMNAICGPFPLPFRHWRPDRVTRISEVGGMIKQQRSEISPFRLPPHKALCRAILTDTPKDSKTLAPQEMDISIECNYLQVNVMRLFLLVKYFLRFLFDIVSKFCNTGLEIELANKQKYGIILSTHEK
jgi:hypothetical protein